MTTKINKSYVTLPLFLAATFTGDYQIGNIYTFYPIWCALILFLIYDNRNIGQSTVVQIQIGISILVAIFGIFGQNYGHDNGQAIIFSILYINFYHVFCTTSFVAFPKYFILTLQLIFLVGTFVTYLSYGRGEFIFGPNIVYRVAGFLSIISFYIFVTKQHYALGVLSLCIGIMNIILTGSRGGILIALVLIWWILLVLMKTNTKNINIKRFLYFIFFSVLVFYLLILIEMYFARLLLFDLTNSSALSRYEKALTFLQHYPDSTLRQFIFGRELNNLFGIHPHNLVMEYLYFYGILFVPVILYWFYITLNVIILHNFKNLRLPMLFFPIFFGALVSGSIIESYTLIAISFYHLGRKVVEALA